MSLLDQLGQKLSQLLDDLGTPDASRDDLQRGMAALEDGRPHEAEAHLSRAVQAAPDHARAWYLLGLSQLKQDKIGPATDSLQRARLLQPGAFFILLTLAEAQRRAGQPDAALDSYKRALSCRVDESLLDQAYAGLGEIYLERGQADRAVRELRKAVAASGGDDLQLLGQLGLAQLRAGDQDLARQSLSRAAAAPVPSAEVLLGLVDVLLGQDDPQQALLAAQRLIQESPDSAGARCALARCQLAAGQPEAAHQQLLRSLEQEPGRVEAHRLLAQVSLAAHDPAGALTHLSTARSLAPPAGELEARILQQMLELQMELDDCLAMGADAEALLALEPDHPLGLAASAMARAEASPDRAAALAERALGRSESYATRLAQGIVLLHGGQVQRAAAELRTALRLDPDGKRARRALVAAYQQLTFIPEFPEPLQLYSLLQRVHDLFVAQPMLAELSPEVARIKEVYDRPLLVTVMGEFNSGKSTFVNALIGEEVAPMGITPTTATINLLKYGRQRGARVLWRDDREQPLQWAEVQDFLGGLDKDRARQIRLVELLYPAEELLRFNVVDTPGLNSMIEEHEQTAREYMSRADAVIWLFSALQAGKQTEEQALSLLGQHRLKTVGVLNKIDRLSTREREQVEKYLEQAFDQLVEGVIPVSARMALEAKVSDQPEALAASRFPELRSFLDQQLFSRGQRIKQQTCMMRLEGLLAAARARTEGQLEQFDRALDDLVPLIDELRASTFPTGLLDQEPHHLHAALEQIYRQAATEVLDFVRPRRWVFGKHRASRADRDFLLELLTDSLRQMSVASHERVRQSFSSRWSQLQDRVAGLPWQGPLNQLSSWIEPADQLVQERLHLLQQQVYTRYNAFARGYLLGGRVDSFFEQTLPGLELDVEPIYAALIADSIDLQQELLIPLGRWYREAVDLVQGQMQRLRQGLDLGRLEWDQRVLAPILYIEDLLSRHGEGA